MFSKAHHALALTSLLLLLPFAAVSCVAETAPESGSEQGGNTAEPVGAAQQASVGPIDCGVCLAAGGVCFVSENVCCPAGSTAVCDGQCVDTNTDHDNCGSCGNVCQRLEGGFPTFCDDGRCL